jgi:hypothetical protein
MILADPGSFFGSSRAKTVLVAASYWSAAHIAMHLLKPRDSSGPMHLSEKSNISHGAQGAEKHISNL